MIFNKKLIAKIIVGVFFVSVLAASVLWFFGNKPGDETEKPANNLTNKNSAEGGLPTVSGNNANINNNNAKVPGTLGEAEVSVLDIESAAVFVAERLGSYSTDTANFKNLKDAQFLMTEKMRGEVDNMINNYTKFLSNNNYYGVTTKALSVELLNQSDLNNGVAKVIVSTQKVETIGKDNPSIKTKYQKMEMILIKDGKWLVDSAIWK